MDARTQQSVVRRAHGGDGVVRGSFEIERGVGGIVRRGIRSSHVHKIRSSNYYDKIGVGS